MRGKHTRDLRETTLPRRNAGTTQTFQLLLAAAKKSTREWVGCTPPKANRCALVQTSKRAYLPKISPLLSLPMLFNCCLLFVVCCCPLLVFVIGVGRLFNFSRMFLPASQCCGTIAALPLCVDSTAHAHTQSRKARKARTHM